MRKVLMISLALMSNMTFGEVIKSRIYAVDESFIKLENGRVVFFKGESLLQQVQQAEGLVVELNVDVRAELESVKSVDYSSAVTLKRPLHFINAEKPAFEPTVLGSEGEAAALFNRLNPKFKRVSECSDRAHVWSYDEFKNYGIKTQKVFVFFTASYIDRTRFKWWFHVAPLVTIKEGSGRTEQKVLDYRFMDRPQPIKTWTDLLVYSKRDCKMTDKLSNYTVNDQTEDCFMMIDSMYYRLPEDLDQMEQGIYLSDFNESEVSGALSRAFRKGNL